MKNARAMAALVIAEAVVVLVYVIDSVRTAGELADWTTGLRIALVVAALVVAVITYAAWSHRNTVHTICAMLLGLLGGAALVAAVSTGGSGEVYGSAPMALVGTLATVAAVVVSQIAMSRSQEAPR
ncbi:hypothetical protein [Aeromicrobium chenweiae]|uniref:hypothetical protein n=1 Tax=Aeromicrobium chenweiae TaxID=2079793 RepID=UPI00109232F9|nr:hypothetical protein [Aeromicrobium chenweiae]TGN30818.1 hypothetical protein E4L97_14430 [Aeromicrobium chenweiae]